MCPFCPHVGSVLARESGPGRGGFVQNDRDRLARHEDRLRQIIFTDGLCLDRAALFVHPPARQAAPFAASLGCDMLRDGIVAVDDLGRTSVPGVYAAGDMARRPTMPVPGQLAAVAAAAGTLAAIAADQELLLAGTGAPPPFPAGGDSNPARSG
jgi:NADPH-dependent 2,4-dienoyl-CoA reductase/sulfur reductase-like enzyme